MSEFHLVAVPLYIFCTNVTKDVISQKCERCHILINPEIPTSSLLALAPSSFLPVYTDLVWQDDGRASTDAHNWHGGLS